MAREPLTSADMDVRDLDGFMLNVERLLASELWALTRNNPAAFRGAVGLWARAWKQIPAASLPNDDAVIAAFADMPVAAFRRNRALVMRGFELCSDGRFYHGVLAAEVRKIWPSVQKKRRDREADNERLKQWRERQKSGRETKGETGNETDNETRFETGVKPVPNGVDTDRDTDTDTDRDRDITRKKPSLRSGDAGARDLLGDPPKKKTKAFPEKPDWVPQEPWGAFLEFRRRKGPFTADAAILTIRKLEELRGRGHDSGEVLNQSVQRGWTGVFEIKPENHNGGNGHSTSNIIEGGRRAIERARQHEKGAVGSDNDRAPDTGIP